MEFKYIIGEGEAMVCTECTQIYESGILIIELDSRCLQANRKLCHNCHGGEDYEWL